MADDAAPDALGFVLSGGAGRSGWCCDAQSHSATMVQHGCRPSRAVCRGEAESVLPVQFVNFSDVIARWIDREVTNEPSDSDPVV